jgi:hypothetical protein
MMVSLSSYAPDYFDSKTAAPRTVSYYHTDGVALLFETGIEFDSRSKAHKDILNKGACDSSSANGRSAAFVQHSQRSVDFPMGHAHWYASGVIR